MFHVFDSSLGGAGDKINLVPQAASLNRGPWKTMENELRAALDAGKKVEVKIDVGYPASAGARPSEFTVWAQVGKDLKKFTFSQ